MDHHLIAVLFPTFIQRRNHLRITVENFQKLTLIDTARRPRLAVVETHRRGCRRRGLDEGRCVRLRRAVRTHARLERSDELRARSLALLLWRLLLLLRLLPLLRNHGFDLQISAKRADFAIPHSDQRIELRLKENPRRRLHLAILRRITKAFPQDRIIRPRCDVDVIGENPLHIRRSKLRDLALC